MPQLPPQALPAQRQEDAGLPDSPRWNAVAPCSHFRPERPLLQDNLPGGEGHILLQRGSQRHYAVHRVRLHPHLLAEEAAAGRANNPIRSQPGEHPLHPELHLQPQLLQFPPPGLRLHQLHQQKAI